jgi:hypothetical protein
MMWYINESKRCMDLGLPNGLIPFCNLLQRILTRSGGMIADKTNGVQRFTRWTCRNKYSFVVQAASGHGIILYLLSKPTAHWLF